MFPEKDKQALNKQVEGAIVKSKLKTEDTVTAASLESKLVTDAFSPVSTFKNAVNASETEPKSESKEEYDKKPDVNKRTDGKESRKTSSQHPKKALSKSRPVKQSKKLKSKKVGKVKGKGRQKGHVPSATPNTEKVTVKHVENSRKEEALKSSQVNNDDVDGKAEDLGARTIEDESKGDYKKKGKIKEDLDNDGFAEEVDLDDKKPVDTSVIKEDKSKNMHEKKQGDSKDKIPKEIDSSKKKSEDESLLGNEPNGDDDVEKLAMHHEQLNSDSHKESTALNGLKEDLSDETENGALAAITKDSMGLTE